MLSLISKNKLENINKEFSIQYDHYLKWLDEENDDFKYYILSTSNVDIRKKSEWNEKGREIYDPNKVREHVTIISDIINKLQLKVFIAQHEYSNDRWFTKDMIGQEYEFIRDKINFIKSYIPKFNTYKFDGGFRIDGIIYDFMYNFADYPFTLKYKNIDIISMERDIVIKIGHHLNIDFVTLNNSYFEKIKGLCKIYNLQYLESK